MRTASACAAASVLMASIGGADLVEAQAAPPPPAVTVSGEGSAVAVPDLAILTSGVVTRAETAGVALKANAAAMTKALAALKDAGVADRDVATAGLTVQPQYDYGDGAGGQRAPKLVGYEVRNTVTIRSREVGKLGELIDTLVRAGSNQIEGLSFDIAEKDAKLDEARKAAVADARRKAELYAAAAGATVGEVLAIDEDAAASDEPARPFAMRAKAMDAAPATPIARGEQEMRARVTVKWGLQP